MSDTNVFTEDQQEQKKPVDMNPEETPADAADKQTEETEESAFAKLQADLDRFRDLALRSEADMQNFRKRATREKEDAIKYANVSFLDRLIPVLDNFEMGLTAARGDRNSAVIAGLEMVSKQFTDFLSEVGVQTIDATGQKFDPNLHQAMAEQESEMHAPGTVLQAWSKAWTLNGRLLRPAMVVVAKAPTSELAGPAKN